MLESKKYKKVIFIDDDSDFVKYYQRNLSRKHLSDYLIYFDNAMECINYLKDVTPNHMPDYILLDLYMPEMNGFEFLEKIEKLNKIKDTVEIFVCTASKKDEDRKRVMKFPFVSAFMEKPLENGFLELLIKEER
jgi:response regulator RpfG family c-di-GMP phosphodiesterase